MQTLVIFHKILLFSSFFLKKQRKVRGKEEEEGWEVV
jgi:hypothetical protein